MLFFGKMGNFHPTISEYLIKSHNFRNVVFRMSFETPLGLHERQTSQQSN